MASDKREGCAVMATRMSTCDGRVIGTHGFYIDVTPSERARQDQVTAAVNRISVSRSGIDQTKGMLMLVCGIDEPTAFELLRWRSQEANVKNSAS
jgi:hypothetical protein